MSGGNQRTTAEKDAGLRRLASWIALMAAVILVIVKFWAWRTTGSIALLTSALDALVDTAASLATFVSVRYAARPADRDHRFGHGKGEAVAAFLQAVLLGGAAILLGIQSIMRLITPEPITAIDTGLWLIAVSLLAAILLVMMQSYVLKRTGSTAIAADRAHYMTDIAVNAAVLLALGTARVTQWHRADPAFAVLIACYMAWNARGIALHALHQLLDRELTAADRQRIEATVLACPEVRGMHDLRTRDAGDRVFIEMHLEIDGTKTIADGHEIGDAVETAVRDLFPTGGEVIVHLEPVGINDDRLDDRVSEG